MSAWKDTIAEIERLVQNAWCSVARKVKIEPNLSVNLFGSHIGCAAVQSDHPRLRPSAIWQRSLLLRTLLELCLHSEVSCSTMLSSSSEMDGRRICQRWIIQ